MFFDVTYIYIHTQEITSISTFLHNFSVIQIWLLVIDRLGGYELSLASGRPTDEEKRSWYSFLRSAQARRWSSVSRESLIIRYRILYILILILDISLNIQEGLLRRWRLSHQLVPVRKVRYGEAFHCLECVLVLHVAWHFQACPSTTASSASYMSMIHTFWYCKGPSRPSRWWSSMLNLGSLPHLSARLKSYQF